MISNQHPQASERPRWLKLARSGLVGVAATLTDLLALFLLVDGLGIDPVWANVPALALGLAIQFVGNKYFAFGDYSPDVVRQGGWFALVEAGALGLNALAFHLLVVLAAVPYLAARVVASATVYFVYSYPLWGLIFRPTPRAVAQGKGE